MTKPQWPRLELRELCDSIVDCVNKTAPTVPEPTPFKMIRTSNVRDGWISLQDVKYVTSETFARWTRRQLPQKGDVILTREAPLGEVGMLRSDDTVFLGQRLVSYRVDATKLDSRFLLYAFQERDLQSQIHALGSGATVEHMRVPDAEKLTLRIPPLDTQRRIADILSAYDDLIENNTRRIAILEEMARSLYREWFVNLRFPGHEDVEITETEDGRLPSTWKRVSLFELAEVTYGFPFKSKLFKEDDEGTAVVRIRDVKAGSARTRTSENAPDKYLLQNGDLLVGMDGDFHIGTWIGGKAFLNQRVVRFRPKSEFSASLLKLSLQAPIEALQHAIVGTTVAHLGDKDLKTVRLIVPDGRTLTLTTSILDPTFDLGVNLRLQNAVLRETRDLLLPKLISGELSVEVAEEELVAAGS